MNYNTQNNILYIGFYHTSTDFSLYKSKLILFADSMKIPCNNGIIKQLKYTIAGVCKIQVRQEQAFFPWLCLWEIGCLLGNWNLANSLNGIL